MKLSSTLSLTLLYTTQVQSFTPSSSVRSSPTSSSTKLNALTAEDILKRARKAAGVEEEPEPEPIFNDGILSDFQESLLLLEKRVKKGPGSLSSSEVQDLDGMLSRILKDMKEYDAGNNAAENPAAAASPAASVAQSASVPVPASAPAPAKFKTLEETVFDHNDELGAAYEGQGGLGLAKGTANTYVIEGMDEMSPEEYRAALQKNVSARQSQRRSNTSTVGNMSSNNYLNYLNKKE